MTQTDSPGSTIPTLRILDAAINRAGEGLRVVEDFARLALNDTHLSHVAKQLRHALTEVCAELDKPQLLAARDTLADVGTSLGLSSEYRRANADEVLAANFARAQQALRTIEEYGKTLSQGLSRAAEQLRYRTYTLEKALLTARSNAQVLENVRVYVLIDGRDSAETFQTMVRQLRDGGADLIQLRDKQLAPRELLARAAILRAELQSTRIRWLLNDRADLALAANADGVHLGQADLDLATARQILGPQKLIGISTHSLAQAKAAVMSGADYLGVGPVFPSQTKSFTEFVGLQLVREVASEISLPAFAIGGIDPSNAGLVRAAGLSRVALSGAVTGGVDPAATLREIQTLMSV